MIHMTKYYHNMFLHELTNTVMYHTMENAVIHYVIKPVCMAQLLKVIDTLSVLDVTLADNSRVVSSPCLHILFI